MLRREVPGAQTRGWRQALRTALEPYTDELDVAPRVPDAFLIDDAGQVITVFEVEVTHPLSPDRLAEWASLWSELDCHGWTLKLYVIDRLGRSTTADLQLLYFALLAAPQEEPA